MKTDKFEVTYEADDGYVTGSRPLYIALHSSDFEDDMTTAEAEQLLEELVEEDFRLRVSWYIQNKKEFLEWFEAIQNEKTG